MNYIARTIGVATLGLTMLAAAPAMAQNQGAQTGQMPSATQQTQDFSQQQLQNFADANAAIRDIRQSAKQKMQQAESRKARMQIRKQARQDMLAAIKDSGLTLNEYNQIVRAAQSNPQLARKIQQMQ